MSRDVCITGIGLITSLGEGVDAHWNAMREGKPNVDAETFAPYPIHPLAEPDWTNQITRRDKRQMEPWQQIGTYAAGLALDDAGLKGTDATDTMDMIVAAGGGERDIEVDGNVLEDAPATEPGAYEGTEREDFVAEKLSNDLRPTLFLAQLSNLLAGNISIVHKVTGSSRTYMGEEGAGIAAIANAHARVASGQSDCMLVGGSFAAAREDMMLVFELGQYLAQGAWKPVWEREDGFALGSVGAFLVLEPREAAEARGAHIRGVIETVAGDHGSDKDRASRFGSLLHGADIVLSGATGVPHPTRMERDALSEHMSDPPVRAYGSLTGHGVEAHFPLGIALAAICLENGGVPAPIGDAESGTDIAPSSVLVTGVGHWRGEGAAVVRKAS